MRRERRAATQEAILDAAAALLRAPGGLTVPAIAERAGVSVPTVHRHFPSRQALLEGVVAHLERGAARRGAAPDPASALRPDHLEPLVRELFAHIARFDHVGDDALQSAAVWELRGKVTVPRRRAFFDEAIRAELADLPEPQRTWLADVLVVLVSSTTGRAMRAYLDLDATQAAQRIAWVLEVLVAECRRLSAASKRGSKRASKPRT